MEPYAQCSAKKDHSKLRPVLKDDHLILVHNSYLFRETDIGQLAYFDSPEDGL